MKPFTEKYKPKKIQDLLLDDIIKSQFEIYVKNKKIPNLIFTGDTGLGKTVSLKCLIKNLYHKDDIEDMVFEIKSTEGIDINKPLTVFCKNKIKEREGFCKNKLIVIDESDNLLEKTQILISSFFSKYENLNFILTCNDLNDIIEAIQSRSLIYSFNKLNKEKIKEKMEFICNNENIKYDDEGLEYLYNISDNDIRKIINNIETFYYSKKNITIENIEIFFCIPSKKNFILLLDYVINNDIYNITLLINDFNKEGYYSSYVISYFINFISTNENIDNLLKNKIISFLTEKLFEINLLSINNYLQLSSCFFELTNIIK